MAPALRADVEKGLSFEMVSSPLCLPHTQADASRGRGRVRTGEGARWIVGRAVLGE